MSVPAALAYEIVLAVHVMATVVAFGVTFAYPIMYAVGAKYRFNQWASWYLVGALLKNDPGAHYCLGPSGHNYQFCSRDQNNDTIGNATIKAISTGLTFDF